MDEATSNLPAPDEVRAQLERMTTSDDFNRSPQLGAFLRFVVEAVLQGKSDRIKAYTIGVDVLRRDAKFDPQLDPIVRVEATRLRRTIDRYYAGLGAHDAVRIDLPRGSYVPTFRRRPGLFGATAHSSTLDRFWPARLLRGHSTFRCHRPRLSLSRKAFGKVFRAAFSSFLGSSCFSPISGTRFPSSIVSTALQMCSSAPGTNKTQSGETSLWVRR